MMSPFPLVDDAPSPPSDPATPSASDLEAAYRHLLTRSEPSYLSPLTLQLLHQFNNRMTGVIFRVDEATQAATEHEAIKQRMDKVRGVLLESLQLINTVGRLHFQEKGGEPTYHALDRVVKTVLPMLEMLLPKGTPVHFEPPAEQLCFYGTVPAVEEILLHLCANAGEALPDHVGEIWLTLGAEDETRSWVSVRDNGPGVAGEIAGRLFAPLATTKDGHAGLGLYRARELAQKMGGALEVHTPENGGAEFRLFLPQSDPHPDA